MRYWNGQRYVENRPTLIPDIRSHLAVWRRFQQETRVLPVLSIATYFLRFVLMAAGVVGVLWYGVANHGWSKGQGLLAALLVLVPALIGWLIVERSAWNYDLRRHGLSSEEDRWDVNQFPSQ